MDLKFNIFIGEITSQRCPFGKKEGAKLAAEAAGQNRFESLKYFKFGNVVIEKNAL